MTRQDSQALTTSRRSLTRAAYCDASLPADLAEALWECPEELMAGAAPLQVKDLRHVACLEWASQKYVLKRYTDTTWRHAAKHSLQRSRAWKTWTISRRLADAGVATPRPVACIENCWGPLRRDSFLMYPYVEGETLRSHLVNESDAAQATGIWRQLRELWQQLRQLRVSLFDSQTRNFILCPAGRLWVIDLDKARIHWSQYFTARYQRRAWMQLLHSVDSAILHRGIQLGGSDRLPR
jgi:tRNA A-37 threonylcarbamoyl transferase component Bud32